MAADALLGHLGSALEALDAVGARYSLIGGLAALLRGCNRFTRDLDFVVLGDSGHLEDLRREFEVRGFALRGGDEGLVLGDVTLWRYWKQLDDVFADAPVDLQVATTPFYRSLVDRATVEQFRGLKLKLVSPEDLIITKLIAFRPLDRADAITVLQASEAPMNWNYLETWSDRLGVRDRLEEVRREAALE